MVFRKLVCLLMFTLGSLLLLTETRPANNVEINNNNEKNKKNIEEVKGDQENIVITARIQDDDSNINDNSNTSKDRKLFELPVFKKIDESSAENDKNFVIKKNREIKEIKFLANLLPTMKNSVSKLKNLDKFDDNDDDTKNSYILLFDDKNQTEIENQKSFLFLKYIPINGTLKKQIQENKKNFIDEKNLSSDGNRYIKPILEKLEDNNSNQKSSDFDSKIYTIQNYQNLDFNDVKKFESNNNSENLGSKVEDDQIQDQSVIPILEFGSKVEDDQIQDQSPIPIILETPQSQPKGPFSIIPSLINRIPFISSYYPPFFTSILGQAFGAIPGPSLPSLPFSPFRGISLPPNPYYPFLFPPNMPPTVLDPYFLQYRQSSPFSQYFPVVINDPLQTFFQAVSNYWSEVVQYGPQADVCIRHGNPSWPYPLRPSSKPEASHRIKRNVDEKQSHDLEDENEKIPQRLDEGQRRYDEDPVESYMDTAPQDGRRSKLLKSKSDKKWINNDIFRKPDEHGRTSSDERRPDIGPQITKLIVRKGGVAIAGAGGIATAGSGGTAIVGPGGTAYTTPASSGGIAMVGPGGKVVRIPEFPASSVTYGRNGHLAPITATGAGHNTFSNPDGSVFTTSDNTGGVALVGSNGHFIGLHDNVDGGGNGKDGNDDFGEEEIDKLKTEETQEIHLPPGARLLTTGPVIYYNPVYPNLPNKPEK